MEQGSFPHGLDKEECRVVLRFPARTPGSASTACWVSLFILDLRCNQPAYRWWLDSYFLSLMDVERHELLCSNPTGTQEEDAFYLHRWGDRGGERFPAHLGFFWNHTSAFHLRCGPLPIAITGHHRLGNYLRIDVDLACVFGGWEVW